MSKRQWNTLNQRIAGCELCPRLRDHCRLMAEQKRASYKDWEYWGKPVPNFGPHDARVLIVGLAPAAHGANRTGRMFSGDRSGDYLFQALHETGFANQQEAVSRDDGLVLKDIAITAVAHCAPPANKPTTEEVTTCFDYLTQTIRLMPNLCSLVALGGIAFNWCLRAYADLDWPVTKPRPKFGHGSVYEPQDGPFLIGSYHPSQQNTFTGRLTHEMLHDIFAEARQRAQIKD